MYFNASPRACALGYAGVSPLQGSLRTGLISYLSFVVLIIIRCRCLRLLSDLLLGAVVCVCCRICWVVLLLAFVVGLAGCRYLRLLSDLLVGVVTCACCWIDCSVSLFAFVVGLGSAGVSAVGTTLLQSPGWRECQRHEQNPG